MYFQVCVLFISSFIVVDLFGFFFGLHVFLSLFV